MHAFAVSSSTSPFPSHFLQHRLSGLYVITHETWGGGHLAIARAALQGGARIIQLRDKSASLAEMLSIGRELRHLTRESGALLIVNDRLDIAQALQADGVHLGPDDMPVAVARRILGPHFLIGASCGDAEEARRAARAGVNYIGAGAIFGTATKSDAGEAIGLDGLRDIVTAAENCPTAPPVAAIGGVSRQNIASTIEAGARMACVISAVTRAATDKPTSSAAEEAMQAATRDLVAHFNGTL